MSEKTTSANGEEFFHLGEIVAAQGLKGCMKLRTRLNNAELLETVRSVWLGNTLEEAQRCLVKQLYFQRKLLYLIIDEVADRTEAEQAVGLNVYTERSQLKSLDENEWWIRDLVGLAVYTTSGAKVGTVCDVVGESGELLEIEKIPPTNKETILVPFVKALVPVVDLANKRIEVVALPGLLD
ncbi:MAG TPA: ribosome maturation factor RimM [Chroococcales cyanobacterium]